ncbi:hypothetical protein [Methanofollis ethanolicus]|uniref:hypothetical protein n=1 Tax=Methanofollis ethanolicus TaxID=488124 RepID=UPI00082A1146|nr:hypothetical protein [Methanofollis ethanolicus]
MDKLLSLLFELREMTLPQAGVLLGALWGFLGVIWLDFFIMDPSPFSEGGYFLALPITRSVEIFYASVDLFMPGMHIPFIMNNILYPVIGAFIGGIAGLVLDIFSGRHP